MFQGHCISTVQPGRLVTQTPLGVFMFRLKYFQANLVSPLEAYKLAEQVLQTEVKTDQSFRFVFIILYFNYYLYNVLFVYLFPNKPKDGILLSLAACKWMSDACCFMILRFLFNDFSNIVFVPQCIWQRTYIGMRYATQFSFCYFYTICFKTRNRKSLCHL